MKNCRKGLFPTTKLMWMFIIYSICFCFTTYVLHSLRDVSLDYLVDSSLKAFIFQLVNLSAMAGLGMALFFMVKVLLDSKFTLFLNRLSHELRHGGGQPIRFRKTPWTPWSLQHLHEAIRHVQDPGLLISVPFGFEVATR